MTARRLVAAVLLACLVAPVEVLALAMVLPLLTILTSDENELGGVSQDFADLTGIEDPQSLALALGVAIIVLFVGRALATLFLRRWTLRLLADAEKDVSVQLLTGYLGEPYERHVSRNSADVLRTIQTSVERTFGGYMASAMSLLAEATIALSIFVLLVVLEPVATLVVATYFAVVAPIYSRVVQSRAYGLGASLQDSARDAIRVAREALDGIKEILVLQRQRTFVRSFEQVREQHATANASVNFLREAPRFFIEIVFLMGVALLVAVLGLTGSGDDAVLILGVFVAAGFRLMPPLGRMISAQATMRASKAAVDDAMTELERLQVYALADEFPGLVSGSMSGTIEFRNVGFRYDAADEETLTSVSFEIRRGESVALVGQSGAGKTTLVDLMLGLLEPTSGTIAVDGSPMHERVRDWRSSVGYVPQDVFLMDGSLRQNVAFGVPPDEIDEALIKSSVGGARLADLVGSLPRGLETTVGERGLRLSGGQRQRIGIARALYSEPHFLVLDEATSALDGETEALVGETIRGLLGEMTVVAIAHRLSTLRDFERVLFVHEGRLDGDGTFENLRTTSPMFARLLDRADLGLVLGDVPDDDY